MARTRPARRARLSARWRHTAAALALTSLALAVGCELARASARPPAAAQSPARAITGLGTLASQVEAAPALAPVRLAPHARRLLVLDAAHRRLAVWSDTGGVTHVGPALGRQPVQLARRGARIGVLDALDARLTVLDSAGRPRARLGLAHLPTPFAACAFPDDTWLVLTAGTADALVRVDAAGTVRWRRPLPWPVVLSWPPLARQGVLAPTREGCAVALAFGPGWAEVLPDGRIPTVMPFREAMPTAGRGMRRWAARTARTPLIADAVVRGDTLEVLVAGVTRDAWQVLDRFHVHTGAYLGSVRLPGPVRAISVTPEGWGAIVPTPRGPRLARLRLSPIPSVGNGLRPR